MAATSIANKLKSGSLLVGNPFYTPILPGSYESIATVAVGSGGATTVTFSSIPSTYKHLQVRAILKNNENYTNSAWSNMYFNGDTSSSYSSHYIQGGASGATMYSGGGATYAEIGAASGVPRSTSAQSYFFGVMIIDILDYADTNKYKTIRSLSGESKNSVDGSEYLTYYYGNWRNSAAISSITFTSAYNLGHSQFSHFALYGVKG